MGFSSFINRACVGLMVATLAVGTALADRDGGGRGRGGGGDRGGSSRSFSGGGGGGGQSSRSFSRGGSSRSFSGESSRSFSSRSSGPARSFSSGSERSSRSFSSGSERSSRPFSSGTPRSFSDSSRSGSSRQYFSRPSDSGSRSVVVRPDGRSNEGRSFNNSQLRGSDRSSVSRSMQNSSRDGRSVVRSGDGSRTFSSDRSTQGRQQYQTRRPTDEQVRDFLQMRGRDGRSDSQFRRDSDGQPRIARQGENVIRGGEGNQRDVRDGRDFSDRFRSDRDGNRNVIGRDGDRNFGNRDGDRVARGGRDRDFGRGDANYQRWRDSAWRGGDNKSRDQRDWSGKWRDGDRFANANRIRDNWRWDNDHWRGRDRNDFPFHGKWWGHRGGRHNHWGWWGDYAWRFNRPFYWWTWATVPRLSSWISFGWPQYYYWDYGPGEYIYYNDGVVYVNGQWYQPAPVFYERTVRLVDSAPQLTADEAAQLEWLPLGVFAVTRDGVAEGDLLMQLAVTKDGVIGGTAYNQNGGASYAIEGIVEKETQRAVWSYTDAAGKKVVVETSIYNLTQPEATGMVHYGPNDSRVVELVRLEQPNAGSSEAVSAPAPQTEQPLPPPPAVQ